MDRHSSREVVPTPAAITKARLTARLTRVEFALVIGVTHTTIGRWERGESTPRGLQLISLDAALEAIRKLGPVNDQINHLIKAV